MIFFRFQYVGLFLFILFQASNGFVLLTANFEDVKKIARKLFSEPVAEKIVEFIAKATGNFIPNVSEENEENVSNVEEVSDNEIESFNKAARQQATSKRFMMQTRKSTTESSPAENIEQILEIVNQEPPREMERQVIIKETVPSKIPQKQTKSTKMTKKIKRTTWTMGHNQAIEYIDPASDENMRHKQNYQIKVPKGKLDISQERSIYSKHKVAKVIRNPEETPETEQSYYKKPEILYLQKQELEKYQRPEGEEYKERPREEYKERPREEYQERPREVYVKERVDDRPRLKILRDNSNYQTKDYQIKYQSYSDANYKPVSQYTYKNVEERENRGERERIVRDERENNVKDERESIVRDEPREVNAYTESKEKDEIGTKDSERAVQESRSLNMDKARIQKARQEYWSKHRKPQSVNRADIDKNIQASDGIIKKQRRAKKRTFRTNSALPNDQDSTVNSLIDIKIEAEPKKKIKPLEPINIENIDTNLLPENDEQKNELPKIKENDSKIKKNGTVSKLNIDFAPINIKNTNNKVTNDIIMRAAEELKTTAKEKSDFDQYDIHTPVVATAGPIILRRLSEKWWEKEMPKPKKT